MKKIYGVGINDAEYVVQRTENGKQVKCAYYKKWLSMLVRCYSTNTHKTQPTYIGCSVCEEWLTFSNFKSWMEKQDWKGKQLDKDLLGDGKSYSPDNCCFVSSVTNRFILERQNDRGDYLVGVHWHKPLNKFRAQCNNPFTGRREHVGVFTCERDAHLAWKKRKHELSCQLADLQEDERVAKALRERYAPDKDWTNK